MKNNIIIKLTGNDLFYYWLQGIKNKIVEVAKDADDKTKKELKKIIKLMN